MTEEPKEPRFSQPEPPKSSPQRQGENPAAQLLTQAQATWQKAQPVLRTQALNVLRLTVQALQGAIAKLEASGPLPV